MNKNNYTEPAELNFSKLEERILQINNPEIGKYQDAKKLLDDLISDGKQVLIIATGGSKVVAYYLQLIIEKLGKKNITCEVIEPRDYFYKTNLEAFSNLVAISASGNSNGIAKALMTFNGKKYLLSENDKDTDYPVIAWGNESYNHEKSFISLATTLGPMALLLDSLNVELNQTEINKRIKDLLKRSKERIERLNVNFKGVSLIHIMSGYETKTSASVLESNMTETGVTIPVVHDKGSFCHGRSNLLFQNPNSKVIYLTHELKELDDLLIESIDNAYSNIYVFNTSDLNENIFWKEYYLILQMYFLSKKIVEDNNMDLTQPEYNPNIVKKLYTFRGDM